MIEVEFRDIFIFEAKSGQLVFAKSYGMLKGDEDLISGFLSSIQSFLAEVAEDNVREIVGEKYRFLFRRAGGYALCVVVDSRSDSASAKRLLDKVISYFMKAKSAGLERSLEEFEEKCDELARSWDKLARWADALDTLDEWG